MNENRAKPFERLDRRRFLSHRAVPRAEFQIQPENWRLTLIARSTQWGVPTGLVMPTW